eukprot:77904-Rhodomonas_salina.2
MLAFLLRPLLLRPLAFSSAMRMRRPLRPSSPGAALTRGGAGPGLGGGVRAGLGAPQEQVASHPHEANCPEIRAEKAGVWSKMCQPCG